MNAGRTPGSALFSYRAWKNRVLFVIGLGLTCVTGARLVTQIVQGTPAIENVVWFLLMMVAVMYLFTYLPPLASSTNPAAQKCRAVFAILAGVAMGCELGIVYLTKGISNVSTFTIIAILGVGGPILVAWAILDAIRDQERQRRAKVLTAVEELEKTNPDLYLIGQSIRDDIAISGRQSGLASLMQNTLFFVAGVALPWVLQSGVPVIHGWLNLK